MMARLLVSSIHTKLRSAESGKNLYVGKLLEHPTATNAQRIGDHFSRSGHYQYSDPWSVGGRRHRAIVLGAVALRRIKKEPAIYGGKGMAIAGIITSVVSLLLIAVFGIMAAIAIPKLI